MVAVDHYVTQPRIFGALTAVKFDSNCGNMGKYGLYGLRGIGTDLPDATVTVANGGQTGLNNNNKKAQLTHS